MNSLAPLIARLDTAAAALEATQAAVQRGAPWAVGATERDAPEHEWAPVEVLAHVAEMLPYWLGEIERIVAGAPEPAPFGRLPTDPIRALTVARDATLPVHELYARIAVTIDRYLRRLPELTERQIAAVGLHPVRGEMSVVQLLESNVVGHLEGHVEQVRGSLPR